MQADDVREVELPGDSYQGLDMLDGTRYPVDGGYVRVSERHAAELADSPDMRVQRRGGLSLAGLPGVRCHRCGFERLAVYAGRPCPRCGT